MKPWVRRSAHAVARDVSAGIIAALAVALWLQGDPWMRAAAAVVAFDLVVDLLSWRFSHRGHMPLTYWIEKALHIIPFTALVTAGAIAGQPWLTHVPDLWWLPVSVLIGMLLVGSSRIDLRALVRGDLAFLAPLTPRSFAAARATADVTSPPLEEAVFRGVAIGTPTVVPGLAVLSGAAFVARHHTGPRSRDRLRPLLLAIETVGAAAFTLLAVLSGSIYPALVAHGINNLPTAILDFQIAMLNGAED